ncbi:MAG: tetraacyldisaccharide 4'-kinase [Deltaproteobacteria bacterium]|nr:tetraacyldisaccharide 4'-kinase [Deltaproteobacteria bacterium]
MADLSTPFLPPQQRWLRTIWSRQGLLGRLGWLALLPFSWGFSLIVHLRNRLYNQRWLAVEQSPVKVISVGNLTVGGAGKTPFVLWLARTLQAQGHKVGILSRGYKGVQTHEAVVVGIDGEPLATPDAVGDEPVMLARRFAGVVIASRDRLAGARLARERFGLELIVLDDGFQHRRLNRDVDILLLSGSNGVHNQWLLPAGPFREPLSAARRAHILIATKNDPLAEDAAPPWQQQAAALQKPLYDGHLEPVALVSSEQRHWQEMPLTELSGKRIMALTGIADPLPFYRALQEWDAEVTEVMEFPDHHQYSQADWQAISFAGQKVELIVTTEKDLVKLERFPFATRKLVALRTQMTIPQEAALLAAIAQHLTRTE